MVSSTSVSCVLEAEQLVRMDLSLINEFQVEEIMVSTTMVDDVILCVFRRAISMLNLDVETRCLESSYHYFLTCYHKPPKREAVTSATGPLVTVPVLAVDLPPRWLMIFE